MIGRLMLEKRKDASVQYLKISLRSRAFFPRKNWYLINTPMQFQRKDAKVIISQILFGWHKKFKKREVQHSIENAHTKQYKMIHPRKMIMIR